MQPAKAASPILVIPLGTSIFVIISPFSLNSVTPLYSFAFIMLPAILSSALLVTAVPVNAELPIVIRSSFLFFIFPS